MPSVVVCGKCHESNQPNATSCQRCGVRLCPNCHQVIESPNSSVCPHCGKKDLSFKPGKHGAGGFAGTGAPADYSATKSICQSCGNRIDPGTKKCPYCGQLGQRFTITPQQGHGVMMAEPAEPGPGPSLQRICPKCGMPFPPGSSQCPKHGKYGGTGILGESAPLLPGRHTGEIWGKVMEKRAASAAAEQIKSQPRHTAPQEIYPQMAGQQAVHDTFPQAEIEAPPRICPSCGLQVPGRSKVCPACGWNRLPPEKARPIRKAEEFYKSRVAISEPYPVYNPPPADQYYGQPAAQPYEAMYTAPPVPMEQPYEGKKWRRERKPRETDERGEKHREKKSPLPLLFALLAFAGVIVLAAVFIMDQLKTPPPPVLPPTTPPVTGTTKAPVISEIQFKNITRDSAVVTWKTDKRSNSVVTYCLEGGNQCDYAKDLTNMVTDHNVKLTGLDPGKAYHITVTSRLDDDPNSPDATKEHNEVLRLLGIPDTKPPVITGVKVVNIVSSTTGSSATITWKTDEPATSQVSYGTSALYGSLQPSQTDTTPTIVHDVILNGLPTQATIHYKVISRDIAGNEASSPNATFVTPPPAGTAKGNSAPDFTLNCADGSTVTLSNLRGGKVILNFWSYNCGFCKDEMPFIQQVHESRPNLPILVICGTQMGPVNNNVIGSFIQEKGYTFTVPLDTTGQVGSLYNVSSVPKTFFLDSTGIIREFKDGSFSGSSAIESLLDSYN